MTAAQALAAMQTAAARYRTACDEFAARTQAWDQRHTNPVVADARKRGDQVRADISTEAAWFRDETIMYAAMATALQAGGTP